MRKGQRDDEHLGLLLYVLAAFRLAFCKASLFFSRASRCSGHD